MTNRSERRDLSKPENVRGHFPDMDGGEVDFVARTAYSFERMASAAKLTAERTQAMISKISAEWKEGIEESTREMKQSLLERIQSVYNRSGWRGLRLEPLLVPVSIALIFLFVAYLPDLEQTADLAANNTVTSFSGQLADNLGWVMGVVLVVGIAAIFFINKSKKQ